MSSPVLDREVIKAISREVEKSPLSPDVDSFLASLELTTDEEKEVVKVLNDLKFQGDNVQALPSNPPELIRSGWKKCDRGDC